MSVNFNKLKKEILEEHNRVRADPKSYVPILKKILTYFKGDVIYKPGQVGIQTEEGQKVYNECIKFLEKQKPLGALTMNDNLSLAAQDHANDIGPKGMTDHDGSNGSTVTDRIEKYMEWDQTVAENLDFGGKTGEEVVVSLIVDDGNPDRGHRKTIFNKDLRFIGIGISKHSEYEICTCLDYVGAFKNEKKGTKSPQDLGSIEPPNRKLNVDPNKPKEPEKVIKGDGPAGDFLFGPKKDLLVDDEDKPKGAVDARKKTTIKKYGNRTLTTIVKTYTMPDGSEEVVEIEERFEM